MSAEAVYLDSSALVKLVVEEDETRSLRSFLSGRTTRVTAALARTEVVRAVSEEGDEALVRATQVLRGCRQIRLTARLLDEAALLPPLVLRSLDAIHLAAARRLGSDLTEFVTYDRRLRTACQGLGLPTAAPGVRQFDE